MFPILYIVGSKEGEKWIGMVVPDRKCIPIRAILNSIRKRFQISGLRIWCPSKKFGHEVNLKSLLHGAIPEKTQTGVTGIEFSRVLKKWNVEISGVNKKRSGISRDDQEKIMWNFHRC